MRTFKPFLLISAFLAVFSSCKPDKKVEYTPNANVNMEVVLMDEGSPVNLYDHVELTTGFDFELQLFKLYISNIKLTTTDGSVKLVKDVEIVSLGDDALNKIVLNVPVGTYKSIEIGYGLNPEQNNEDPSSFDQDHPLSNYQNMYWPMIKYRFAKLEGFARSLIDSSAYLVSIHPGTDPLYQVNTYDFAENISIDEDYSKGFVITLDIKDIFDGPAGVIDFSKDGADQVHSIESGPQRDIHIAQRFMENLAAATELELAE